MSKTRDITVTVNGEAFAAAVEPRLLLADLNAPATQLVRLLNEPGSGLVRCSSP